MSDMDRFVDKNAIPFTDDRCIPLLEKLSKEYIVSDEIANNWGVRVDGAPILLDHSMSYDSHYSTEKKEEE